MSFRLIDSTTPVAAKDHKCIWCGEKILKGEKYNRQKSVATDGDFFDNKFHPECYEACSVESTEEGGDYEFDAYNNPRGSHNE